MFKIFALFALAALSTAQKSDVGVVPALGAGPIDGGIVDGGLLGGALPAVADGLVGGALPAVADGLVGGALPAVADGLVGGALPAVAEGLGHLPVEVAPLGSAGLFEPLAAETLSIPAPDFAHSYPDIHLPKGPQEVVDVPHAPIVLAGNSIQNQDLLIDLPSPMVQAPKPIVRTKEVLFKLPQAIFYVPKPLVQHKPMVYRVGHSLKTNTPKVLVKEYLFSVPSAQITGKSAYSQPIPLGKGF